VTAPRENELRDRPTGELLKRLSDETTTLVKQEVELAKAELQQKGKQAGIGAGMFGGAGLFGVGAFAALTACIIAALESAMALWLAALIVTVVYAAVAGVLAMRGKQKVKEAAPPVPEQTKESVKEDVEWAKTRARSGRT
jgi:uncharacterized membrane protein YqjE